MGWQLIQLAADLPDTPVTAPDQTQAVTVALIAALGTVVVALIGWASSVRSSRTTSSPPPDTHLGERVAVAEAHDKTTDRTLAQLDRHVDGVSDLADRTSWRVDEHEARFERLEKRMDRNGLP